MSFNNLASLKDPEKRFKLLQVIGNGTYGKVYKAVDHFRQTIVALKMMDIEEEDERFLLDEINLLVKASNHVNVARFFDAFCKKVDDTGDDVENEERMPQLWISMEYCAGGSISQLIKLLKHAPFSEGWIAYITGQVMDGVEFLHAQHIIHRDIKSHNILLNHDCQVKLVDFGVSAQIEKTLNRRNTFIGTPYWMAPEVILCQDEENPVYSYDFKCDIWSIGITCIEMAEGRAPFSNLHPMRALLLIAKNPPPKLDTAKIWSVSFHDFVEKCLIREPANRPDCTNLKSHSFIAHYREQTETILVEIKDFLKLNSSLLLEKSSISSDDEKSTTTTIKNTLTPETSDVVNNHPVKVKNMSIENNGGGSICETVDIVNISEIKDAVNYRRKLTEIQGLDLTLSNINSLVDDGSSNTIVRQKNTEIEFVEKKLSLSSSQIHNNNKDQLKKKSKSIYTNKKDKIDLLQDQTLSKFAGYAKKYIDQIFANINSPELKLQVELLLDNPKVNNNTPRSSVKSNGRDSSSADHHQHTFIDHLKKLNESIEQHSNMDYIVSSSKFEPSCIKSYSTKVKSKTGSSGVLSVTSWGINIIFGTEQGLFFLDRSGSGAITQMIGGMPFKKLDTVEHQDILITISGPSDTLRVYILSSFQSLFTGGGAGGGNKKKKKHSPVNNASNNSLNELDDKELQVLTKPNESCFFYKMVIVHNVMLLIISLRSSIEIFAWAQEPYNKFMPFKSFTSLPNTPSYIHASVVLRSKVLSIFYTSDTGFHGFEMDSGLIYDVWLPNQGFKCNAHAILSAKDDQGTKVLLFATNESREARIGDKIVIKPNYAFFCKPHTVVPCQNEMVIGLSDELVEVRQAASGLIYGLYVLEKPQYLKLLCERNGKIYMTSPSKQVIHVVDLVRGCKLLNI